MPTSEVALRILFILLPGFCAAYFVQALTVRAKQSDLEKVIEAALFSFLIYVTFYLVHPRLQPSLYAIFSNGGTTLGSRPAILSLLAITFCYAIALILFINKDGTTFLRRIGITERTSRSSIWNDAFQNEAVIVQVELADGRNLQGLVGFYSDTAEESSIFLQQARWVGNEGELIEIPGPGILLTREAKIIAVSFLDPQKAEYSTEVSS